MACAGIAQAQSVSIWGTPTPKTDKPAITAPAPQAQPVTPYAAPMQEQQIAPAPVAPKQVAPAPVQKPAWSLDDVPSDPIPRPLPTVTTPEDPARPAIVMDKNDVLGAIKNPESRKFLEQYSQGGSFVFPQNPPEMNENTAQILPYPQWPIVDESADENYGIEDECLSKDCLDDEQEI